MIAEASFGINPEFLVAQIFTIIVLVAILVLVKRALGYLGFLFAACLIGIMCAGYYGIERLNNFEAADDVAGAILLSSDVLALLAIACYCHNRQAGKK